MYFKVQLKINTGRDTNSSMTDWIDKRKAEHDAEQERQRRHQDKFGPTAQRIWEALATLLRRDAQKLNKTPGLLKGEIRIDGREIITGGSEVNLDRLAFPAVYLTVGLDIGAESIRIEQVRVETPEGESVKTIDRLQLELVDQGPFYIKDRNGTVLDAYQASEYILAKFLI